MGQRAILPYEADTDCEHPIRKRVVNAAGFVTVAAAGAAVINLIVYFVASSAGGISHSVNLIGSSGISAGLVLIASAIGVALAASTFAVVGRFSHRPVRTFRIIATVVLLLSFVPVLSLPGAPAAMIVTLLVMHLVVWCTSVTLLPKL
ncbi:MAG TPA: DUF6069 family protein, partial [Nitrolancea sp.]|nr:DUF6069 family protein [Nitrolancea sp.]